MSKGKRPYIGPSDAQANAEALVRRSSPYTAASEASLRVAWDWRQRDPVDLREAVRMVRRAYADEVPEKLHDGPDAIGEGGTPRFASRAEGYLFGDARASDAHIGRCICADPKAEHDDDCPRHPLNQPLVSYYHTPFRATLDRFVGGGDKHRLYGRIVSAVTIGQQGPQDAAIAAGVRPSCVAKDVAEDAIRTFLRSLTDLKLHIRQVSDDTPLAETVTAA